MADIRGRLTGKVAVITGGGNGIGRATSVRFAEEGAAVVVADLLDGPGAETVAAVEDVGGHAVFVRCDVTSRIDNDAVAAAAIEQFGGLHIAVTAAGISHPDYVSGDYEAEVKRVLDRPVQSPARAFAELPREELHAVFEVNLTGTMLTLQSCVAALLDHGSVAGTSFITIASIAAKHPDAGTIPYGISKASVWYLTKKLARDLAPEGVRVNAIGPGFIDTHMTAILDAMPEDRKQQFFGAVPMGRKGMPREIANAALFLASDESSYFTGEILHPDGGFYTE
jgi:NAD(P)-dependent dehydrogenase (short-subunit alcohol dehydrogenase family)